MPPHHRNLDRRHFLRTLAGGLGSAGIAAHLDASESAPKPQPEAAPEAADKLTGFIVADAHFGWVNRQQPDIETQREMMRRIVRRFPDLDIFIDTGDIHHGGLRGEPGEIARRQWTDLIANGCGTAPFAYVPGNHEIMGTREGDPEWRCERIGSLSCRPYYSFDVKGIHFVSLPELMRVVYITREALDWLELDLAVHADQTTMLLSHNSLAGTTGPFEEGYRGLVVSKTILDIMRTRPNVVAWMHGHNHNYQVVARDGELFVSNGRIGGFDPSRKADDGPYGLGGILFEINRSDVTVRSYSAERQAFLDDLGVRGVSGRLAMKTSFDPTAPTRISYGYGGARDGQRTPVYHHHAGPHQKSELFIAGVTEPEFNDDPSIELFMSRRAGRSKKPHWQLMGSLVRGGNGLWEHAKPGIRLLPRQSPTHTTSITVPHHGHGQVSHYRCAPGRIYRADVHVDAGPGSQTLRLTFFMHDRDGKQLWSQARPIWTLKPGEQRLSTTVNVPEMSPAKTIYSDQASDNATHLMVQADASKLTSPLLVRRVALSLANAKGETSDAAIVVDGKEHATAGKLEPGKPHRCVIATPRSGRSVIEARATGSRRVTWLIRQTDAPWQVRNAAAVWREGRLDIGPITNPYTKQAEVVIAPLERPTGPYVHRLRQVEQARVIPATADRSEIRIDLVRLRAPAEIIVVGSKRPKAVEGADGWEHADGRIVIKRNQPGVVVVRC